VLNNRDRAIQANRLPGATDVDRKRIRRADEYLTIGCGTNGAVKAGIKGSIATGTTTYTDKRPTVSCDTD
jgi:hypothetical protein